MKYFKSNTFEIIVAILTLFSIVGLSFYFYDLKDSNSTINSPYVEFYNNPGIVIISFASLISMSIFIICFGILSVVKFRGNKVILTVYILSALIIGFLQWYELYYGSTFYYGEVRDKQGLMFPVLSFLMATLVIWKFNYSVEYKRNLAIKLILTVLVFISLRCLWILVYESWKLWQS